MVLKVLILCAASYSLDRTDTKSQWFNICANMDHVLTYSQELDVKPESLIALSWHESRWRPGDKSDVGACGILQVVPKYTNPRVTCQQLKDPEVGLLYGAKALRLWLNKTSNHLTRAYCHYNCGNECFEQGLTYARDIMKTYRKLKRLVTGYEKRVSQVKSYFASRVWF